ncbi:MAG: hypothetical protein J0H19_17930 [Rhodospirillales bacterium]|nr:hypothetical protein [Rhodospirillales bacterium]MBN8928493.1 hypothetical protein [Rhodospirillales bacterium]
MGEGRELCPSSTGVQIWKPAMMQNGMGSGMMWGMGLVGLLTVVLLVLGIAALGKYLFRN